MRSSAPRSGHFPLPLIKHRSAPVPTAVRPSAHLTNPKQPLLQPETAKTATQVPSYAGLISRTPLGAVGHIVGLTRPSQTRLEELDRYIEVYGDANVPVDYEGGLGQWLTKQRTRCRQGLLSLELRIELMARDVIWAAKPHLNEPDLRKLEAFTAAQGPKAPRPCWPAGSCGERRTEGTGAACVLFLFTYSRQVTW